VGVELETVAELRAHVEAGGGLDRAVLQGLDLTAASRLFDSADLEGAVFLGCRLPPALLERAVAAGCLVFPALPGLPYQPYRSGLYTVSELLAGYRRGEPESYWDGALDGRIFKHFDRLRRGGPVPLLDSLAQRLHDHSIDDALADLLHDPARSRRVVAIMGGHAVERGGAAFREVVRLGHGLTREGFFVATGGGPGAMEAGNLGAWLAHCGEADLERAVGTLSRASRYTDPGFVDRGLDVRESFPDGTESLAIPTWFYGHEPTNLFATHIAKYFANSLREEGLLSIASWGVVFAPGSAGTIQEVFMDAAQNHYGSLGVVSPMVFLGVDHWTRVAPVYPLLRTLASGRQYEGMLTVVEDAESALRFLVDHPPVPCRPPEAGGG